MSRELETENYVGSTNEWLDREARTRLDVGLGELADRVAEAIQLEVPEYGRPLEGEFGRNVRLGIELALRRFIGEELEGAQADLHRRLGAGEYRAGRSLDALQSAYRIGARVAWRAFSDAAAAAGPVPMPSETWPRRCSRISIASPASRWRAMQTPN